VAVFYKQWCVFYVCLLLLLFLRYNYVKVLALSTITFYLRLSWTSSVHFISFVFFKLFLTSSTQRDLNLPTGLIVNVFNLYISFTILLQTYICVSKPTQSLGFNIIYYVYFMYVNTTNYLFTWHRPPKDQTRGALRHM
jgi:hypothetical protein